MFNQRLAFQKIYTAISSLTDRSGPVALRPSNIGGCALKLQWMLQPEYSEERNPRWDWMALQGTVNEELFGHILEAAGAQVLHPPTEQDSWEEDVEPDPETGFKPHLDRLVLWPEVGIDEWTVFELKYQRAMAQISFFTDGLFEDQQYWAQAVTYLNLAPLAIWQYAAAEQRMGMGSEAPWSKLREQGVAPQQLVFFSIAKDPSTARMLLQQRIKAPQYETNPTGKAPSTPAQIETARKQALMTEWRVQIRERLVEVGGEIDFHMELHHLDDESVQDTWTEIKARVRRIKEAQENGTLVEPSHDIRVGDEELDQECRYCPFFEKHKNMFEVAEVLPDGKIVDPFGNVSDPFERFDK